MQSLSLMHPWLLAGGLLAALPVLIHLIGRRRAPTVRFAAFDFLVAVNRRLANLERLRQFMLLALRTLAIFAVVLAVARPMPTRSAVVTQANRRIAIVVDASRSMSYVRDGKTLLELANRRVREILSHLQPGDAATLVVAGREVTAMFQAPTLDLAAVRAAMDRVRVAEGVGNLGGAIETALAQLGRDGANASLVVVTDLAENSFAQLRPTAMDPPPEVRLIDVAERAKEGAPLPNVAVESVDVQRSADAPGERRIKATIRNFGGEAVSQVPIELAIDGEVRVKGFVDVAPQATEEKTLTYNFDGTGIFRAEVRLAQQTGYTYDDVIRFVIDVAPGVRVLAVNGDPRTTPYEDELFFLERALQAVPKGEPPIELRIVSRDELVDPAARVTFEGTDVVVLANVGALTADVMGKLRKFVAAGGGLLITMGDKVNFEQTNELFGDLLPHALRDLHKAADEATGSPPLAIDEMDWDHPILAGLGLAIEESLRASRTAQYFNLDVGASVKALPIVRFDNGTPALIERRDPKGGRVMMLTTSVDVDFSDMPLRSAFPPLMQRTVRYLSRAIGDAGVAPTRAGLEIEVPAPTGALAVALVSPSGERLTQSTEEGSRRRVKLGPLLELGFYTAEIETEAWAKAPRLDVAVNPALDESDFKPVRADTVSEALGGGEKDRVVAVTVGSGEYGDPFEQRGYGTYLLLAMCLLFIGESLLAARG